MAAGTPTITRYRLIPVLFDCQDYEMTLPEKPIFLHLKNAIGHHFDEPFEHVAVLWDGRPLDMFVGETSSINGRHIRNIRATEIYRNNTLQRFPDTDPESLPPISGPAVLFGRRVWF